MVQAGCLYHLQIPPGGKRVRERRRKLVLLLVLVLVLGTVLTRSSGTRPGRESDYDYEHEHEYDGRDGSMVAQLAFDFARLAWTRKAPAS
jgi:hypothetical protein